MTQSTEKQHERKNERIQVALEIRYRSAGAFLVSYSVNLSKGGLFIETSTPLPRGDRISLKLVTPDEETIELSGVVAWVRRDSTPTEPPGMGIEFDTPEESYGLLVDEMASRFSGITVLLALGPGQDRTRAVVKRHLAAIVSCSVVDVDDAFYPQENKTFDVALVNLDWIEGEEVVNRLGQGSQPVPLIVLGHSFASRERGESLGAIGSLDNPPSFSDLRSAVISALSRPESVTA